MIFYLVPSSDKPSWGLAIIYHHVKLLIENGIDACIVIDGPLATPAWLEIEVPVESIGGFKSKLQATDYLIVPEVMVNFPGLKNIACKKIVFIQAGGYIFESMPSAETHISLGFEHAWIIMPHMKAIVEKHLQIPYTIIPPFIAPHFFNDDLFKKRKKQILLYPKFQQVDYTIVKYILEQHLTGINESFFRNLRYGRNWNIKELKNLTSQQVAEEMKESIFFVSLNTFEALNTSVVEAMAAGCVVFCYEGVGPRDYLENEQNAIVFKNNEAYQIAENLCNWIDQYSLHEDQVMAMRINGYRTARQFSRLETEKSLINFFQ